MKKCTVVIPTYNRPEKLKRAIASAEAQTVPCRIIVADGGDVPADVPADVHHVYIPIPDGLRESNVKWYLGAYAARTEFVAFLFDDDWYEPTFIERALPLFEQGAGYVIGQAMLHLKEGNRPNLPFADQSGQLDADHLEKFLMNIPLTISPSSCVFRRDDILDNLFVNRVPGCRTRQALVGPDLLLLMMPLLKYQTVGWVGEPLVNFDGWDGSLTIDALADEGKARQLREDYAKAKEFYQMIKEASLSPFDIEAWLIPGDIRFLTLTAKALPENPQCAEIGTWKGGSAVILCRTRPDMRLHCVDTWQGSPEHAAIDTENLHAEFMANIERYGVVRQIVEHMGDSVACSAHIPGSSLDLIFIDGDHSEEGCGRDLAAWWPRLKPNGVFIVHDCVPGEGVEAAVVGFCKQSGLQFCVTKPPEAHYMATISR